MKRLECILALSCIFNYAVGMQQALQNVSTNVQTLTQEIQKPTKFTPPPASNQPGYQYKYNLTGIPNPRSAIYLIGGEKLNLYTTSAANILLLATITGNSLLSEGSFKGLKVKVNNLRAVKSTHVTTSNNFSYDWYGTIEQLTVNNKDLKSLCAPCTIQTPKYEQFLGITQDASTPANPKATDSVEFEPDTVIKLVLK